MHGLRDIVCRRAGMDEDSTVEDPDIAKTEVTSVIDGSIHHDAVCTERVVYAERVEDVHKPISSFGVYCFENVLCRAEDAFTVHDCGYSFFGKRVSSNRDRGTDGADAQFSMKGGVRVR